LISKGVKELKTEQTQQPSLHISQEKLLAFVRAMISGRRERKDDEHPLPPGPWDSAIRVALKRFKVFGPQPEPWRFDVFGPSPEPWRLMGPGPIPWRIIESVFGNPVPWEIFFASTLARHPESLDSIGGDHSFGEEVALNPQPLPPRYAFLAFLAQTVISRAELIQEIIDTTQGEGQQQDLTGASRYIARFVDDCLLGKVRWPFPVPPPHWFVNELDGIDLLVMATQFEQTAKGIFSSDLRKNLADASAKFAEAGLSKMQ
jgi:hypothetical protein